jgi:dienelactone hydrolase
MHATRTAVRIAVLFCFIAAAFSSNGCKKFVPVHEDCTPPDNATTPAPAFSEVDTFTAVFGSNNDQTDFYYPAHMDSSSRLPIALFLQGGRCDKQYYSGFAEEVAKYGFIVAVPNHYHAFKMGPLNTDGLFSEATQMQEYIDYMKAQNGNGASPFYQKVDPTRLLMLGHSYGAACTIYAIQNDCIVPFCTEETSASFQRPVELKAAALCGINTKPRGKPFDYRIYPTDNQGVPLAFVNGSLDNNATPEVTKESYDTIMYPPRMLVYIIGANHYASLNVNNPPDPGPGLGKGPGEDPNVPVLSQQVSSETAARWCALFLRAYGLGDPLAKFYVEQAGKCLDENVQAFIDPGDNQ